MRVSASSLTVFGTLVLAGARGLTAQSGTYPIHGDDIAIYNLAGILRVEPATGVSDVVVVVQTGGSDAGRLKVATGVVAGHDGLRVIYPADVVVYPAMGSHSNTTIDVNDDGTFGERDMEDGHRVRLRGDGSGLEAWADLTVKVPAGKTVALHLGVGKASVTNVDGQIRVALASSDVSATGAKGTLGIATGSGDIHVTNAAADLKLETGSGDITLSGVTDGGIKVETGSGDVDGDHITTGHLELSSGSGSITISGVKAPEIGLETGSGDVDIGLLDGIQTLRGTTGSGSITLTVPSTLNADVDLDTGSGEIDLGGVEVKVRKLESDHLSGTIGNGGGRIKLEAGSGDISLRKS